MTGASGLIGTILRQEIEEKYDLTNTDIISIQGKKYFRANMTDLKKVRTLTKNQDAIVHLAWNTKSENCLSKGFAPENIAGVRAIFESARLEDVKKVVFASSNHVTGRYEKEPPYCNIVTGNYDLVNRPFPLIDCNMPVRPDSPYGASKAFGEALGRFYSEEYGIDVYCLRLGSVNRANRPQCPRHFATFLSHKDLCQLVEKCLTSRTSYGIFYGVSDNHWRFWDIKNAQMLIGYHPIDSAVKWNNAEKG